MQIVRAKRYQRNLYSGFDSARDILTCRGCRLHMQFISNEFRSV